MLTKIKATYHQTHTTLTQFTAVLSRLIEVLDGWERDVWYANTDSRGLPLALEIHYHAREGVGKAILWRDGVIYKTYGYVAETRSRSHDIAKNWYESWRKQL